MPFLVRVLCEHEGVPSAPAPARITDYGHNFCRKEHRRNLRIMPTCMLQNQQHEQGNTVQTVPYHGYIREENLPSIAQRKRSSGHYTEGGTRDLCNPDLSTHIVRNVLRYSAASGELVGHFLRR